MLICIDIVLLVVIFVTFFFLLFFLVFCFSSSCSTSSSFFCLLDVIVVSFVCLLADGTCLAVGVGFICDASNFVLGELFDIFGTFLDFLMGFIRFFQKWSRLFLPTRAFFQYQSGLLVLRWPFRMLKPSSLFGWCFHLPGFA